MKVLIDSQISINKWVELIKLNPYASPFQTKSFYLLFNSINDYTAKAIAIEKENKIIALAVVTIQKESGIKKYFSRRAIIYGGPIIESSDEKACELLLVEINKALKDNVIYIETRNLFDYNEFRKLFKEQGWHYERYLNFQLNCSTKETALSQFHTNRKRQINKALKNGVSIREANSLNDVKVFYEILENLYTGKIKKPLLNYQFFENFYTSNIGKYLLVIYKEQIIGGIMCPILPERCIYEFYICGLDQEYKEASPSVMATYAAIEYGYSNNLKYFDFMGAGKPDSDYGVRKFKEKFGGKPVEYGRYIKINNPFLYHLGKLSLTILQKIKK